MGCCRERDRGDPGLRQRLQLARIGHAILIKIAPDAQCAKGGVGCIDQRVAIAVEGGQCGMPGHCRRAEEFALVVDCAIAIEITRQQAIILAHPAGVFGKAVIVDVEINPIVLTAQLQPIAIKVYCQGIDAGCDGGRRLLPS